MRLFLLPLLLIFLPLTSSVAQQLPHSATPRGVLFAFLTETASGAEAVDRMAFSERLSGELLKTDPRSLKSFLPADAIARIDSIPNLSRAPGGNPRVVGYVTVHAGKETTNLYIFCSRDSIWRLDAIRSFPTFRQRTQIAKSLRELDTTTRPNRLLHADLQRVLLSDDSLSRILLLDLPTVSNIVQTVSKGRLWKDFAIRDVDFLNLDEYRELDDDVSQRQMVFYSADREALEEIKAKVGIRRLVRDDRYPGTIFLVGANVQGNTYGYIYAPGVAPVPEVSGKEFIMVKPITPGWWIYKRVEGKM
jgi:hypothetical protein